MSHETADLSQPKILNHLIKGAIFGVASFHLYRFASTCQPPWNYAVWFLTWLCLAACLRNIHALIVMPRLVLSEDGVSLRYWRASRFLTWRMFLPWNIVVDTSISWSDYVSCQAVKRSGGDPWDAWQRLYIKTMREEHEVGWDVFSRNVTQLMDQINAYRSQLLRQSDRENLDYTGFQRERFATPVRLTGPTPARTSILEVGCMIFLAPFIVIMFGAAGCLVTMFGGIGIALALRSVGLVDAGEALMRLTMDEIDTPMRKMPMAIPVGAIGGNVIGFLAIFVQVREQTMRVLELSSEGFAFGPTAASMQLVAWEDVVSSAIMELTTRSSDGSVSRRDELKIQFRNRSALVLGEIYNRTLADLDALIDPPNSRLAEARNHMKTGLPIAAALAAGLPDVNAD